MGIHSRLLTSLLTGAELICTYGELRSAIANNCCRPIVLDVKEFLSEHEDRVGLGGMKGETMDAEADFGIGLRQVGVRQTLVDGRPSFAAVVGTEVSCSRNRNEDAVGIRFVEDNRVQAHAARPRLP